eukprot:5552362-Prymnesium_polylepis.1
MQRRDELCQRLVDVVLRAEGDSSEQQRPNRARSEDTFRVSADQRFQKDERMDEQFADLLPDIEGGDELAYHVEQPIHVRCIVRLKPWRIIEREAMLVERCVGARRALARANVEQVQAKRQPKPDGRLGGRQEHCPQATRRQSTMRFGVAVDARPRGGANSSDGLRDPSYRSVDDEGRPASPRDSNTMVTLADFRPTRVVLPREAAGRWPMVAPGGGVGRYAAL